MRRRRLVVLALAPFVVASSARAAQADATPASSSHDDQVRIAPGPDGGLGAWLVLGPFPSATHGTASGQTKSAPAGAALTTPPSGVEEAELAPRAGTAAGPALPPRGEPPRWTLASGSEGTVDLVAPLGAAQKSDLVAYAAGVLHVGKPGRHYLLLGCDDGVRVSIDGRVVLTRDDARPVREDDDVVPLELTAGDHLVVLKLHQRDGAWAFRPRFVDAAFTREDGTWLTLPGTTSTDARILATKMSWVSLDRGLRAEGYAPRLKVELRGGFPLDVPLPVRARLTRVGDAAPLVDVSAGEVPAKAAALEVALPWLSSDLLAKIEDRPVAWSLDVAGRSLTLPFAPRRDVRLAVARLDRALASLGSDAPPWLGRGTRESATRLRDRLVRFVAHGDADLEAERDEAREIDAVAKSLEAHVDPFAGRTGPMRRAYRSPLDGALSEYGVYVPASYTPGTTRRYPLVVALHGLNGQPMEMIRWLFGGDDPKHDGYWEDRHLAMATPPAPPLSPPLEAFILTPSGRGSTMYREQGEEDVLAALDEVLALYPIDLRKVTITGPSMGGIGSALVPLRHPDRFAAAEPLCGYHSYFVRHDVAGRPLRPWERFLAEERSNAFWAENGARLPLFIVHGTLDLPEANSGSLIERYETLKFDVTHEHPHLGHNVWQTTYENMKGVNWLLGHTADVHPARIHFRTAEARDGDDAWLHVDELGAPNAWGDVEARVTGKGSVELTTRSVNALHLDRDEKLLDPRGAVTVTVDGARLAFAEGAPLALHREGSAWVAGERPAGKTVKRGLLAGPFRDVYRVPLLFVYGASDPLDARVNEEVARAWASVHPGIDVSYEVVSDVDFLARGDKLANDRALFLVGNARTNRVVAALEADLPVHIEGGAVVVGGQRLRGREAGAAFVYPNPKRPDRYVAVVEGVDATGTLRSLSLPDLIPDFVVYDAGLAPARGQLLLGAGRALAAGFFENDWSVPAKIDDPRAAAARPVPEPETPPRESE